MHTSLFTVFFETRSLSTPLAKGLTRLTGHRALETFLSLPALSLSSGVIDAGSIILDLYVGGRVLNSGPHICEFCTH